LTKSINSIISINSITSIISTQALFGRDCMNEKQKAVEQEICYAGKVRHGWSQRQESGCRK
jgi:hypothetical protein